MADADPGKTFNVHDAKTHFSKLIDRAHAGETIVLAKDGKPWAQLGPLAVEPDVPLPPRKPGRFKHLLKDVPSDIWLEPSFTDEDLDAFEGRIDNP